MPQIPMIESPVLMKRRTRMKRGGAYPRWLTHYVAPTFVAVSSVVFIWQTYVEPIYELKTERNNLILQAVERERDALERDQSDVEEQRTALAEEVRDLKRERDSIRCELAGYKDELGIAIAQLRVTEAAVLERSAELVRTNDRLAAVSAKVQATEAQLEVAGLLVVYCLKGFEMVSGILAHDAEAEEAHAGNLERWALAAEARNRNFMLIEADLRRIAARNRNELSAMLSSVAAHVRDVPLDSVKTRLVQSASKLQQAQVPAH